MDPGLMRLKGKVALWRATGLCVSCGGARAGQTVRCRPCIDKQSRRQNERIDIAMECKTCGTMQTEPLLADAIMLEAVARVKCLFCGTKTMTRAR